MPNLTCVECGTKDSPVYYGKRNGPGWVCRDCPNSDEPKEIFQGVVIKRTLVNKQISAATEAHLKDKTHTGKGFIHNSTGRPWHWQGS